MGLVLPEKYVSIGVCLILVSSPIQHNVESCKLQIMGRAGQSQDQSVANIPHNQYGFGVCNPNECDETLRFTCVHSVDGALGVRNAAVFAGCDWCHVNVDVLDVLGDSSLAALLRAWQGLVLVDVFVV